MTETLGERIKQYRLVENYSLRAMADLVGVSHGYIDDIERGRRVPSQEMQARIAEAFGVTVECLRGG